MKEMKKFLLALLVVAVPMTFAACSDDDDPEPEVKLADTVKGTYTGKFTVELDGLETEEPGEGEEEASYDISVTFTATADNTATVKIGKLTLPEFGNAEATISDIEGVALTGDEAKVEIAKQAKKATITVKMEGADEDLSFKDVDVTLSGSIESAKTLKLSATLPIAVGDLKGVEVEITANK